MYNLYDSMENFLYYGADLAITISPDICNIIKNTYFNSEDIFNFFNFYQNQFKRKQKLNFIFDQ